MKIAPVSLILLGSIFSVSAFAIELRGTKAHLLYDALKGVGATSRQFTESALISVSDVRAGSSFTARGKLGHVEMLDNNTGLIVRASDPAPNDAHPANTLLSALTDAGVKEETRPGGSSLDVKAIQCSIGHMGAIGFYNCKVTE